ncbi:hypothetical protein KAZ57_03505 [Patescibacteria group bacterium]|nr:hypothetical protein [Patescibacteria group bacterium]
MTMVTQVKSKFSEKELSVFAKREKLSKINKRIDELKTNGINGLRRILEQKHLI